QAVAENIEQRRATFTLSSTRINLAEVPLLTASPPVQLDQVDAKGEFQLQNDGSLVTGSIRAARADLYPFRVQDLRSDIVLTPAAFSFKNLSAQMANGTVYSEGYWAPPGGRLQEFDFTSKVAALDLRELATQFFPAVSGRLAGLLSGQARFTAALPEGANIKDRIETSGEASVQQGTIRDFNLIAHLLLRGSDANISRSRLPPSLAALIDRRDTPFDSLKTNFTVEQKRIRTDNLVITTPEYTLTGAGWIGFDRSTNWNGLLIFSPRVTEEFQRDYRIIRRLLDRRGRLAVSFRVDGKIPNVKIRLDNRALAQAIGTGPAQDKESEPKPGQEPKEVKRWIPDAIERFLNR
ncbi:MAG TPA: AsmA-like C-terminal region-containing protein, partial [Candidatus Binatia bacterium]|nr:AsmA-like C-terminal region-containing protein [Candidatus Binatia bacterium]